MVGVNKLHAYQWVEDQDSIWIYKAEFKRVSVVILIL